MNGRPTERTLAYLSLGDAAAAADGIGGGLAGLPAGQQGAEWTEEYREALERAAPKPGRHRA